MDPCLAQLSISPGGIPKQPIDAAHVSREGVAGDWQRNRRYHGGPDRAVCIFSEELYALLREDGVDLAFGAVGENFTTRGIDLQSLGKGDQLRVGGSCTVELTDVRVPCGTLKKWNRTLPALIEGRSGWVAKVISVGAVRAGDSIEVIKAERSAERFPQQSVTP